MVDGALFATVWSVLVQPRLLANNWDTLTMNKWIQSKTWGEFGVHIVLVCDQSGYGQPLQKEEAQDMHNRHMYTN